MRAALLPVVTFSWLAVLGAPRVASARVHTSTEHVEAMIVVGGDLWVATRGGVERYDLASGARTALVTTEHGLASNHVLALEPIAHGVLATSRTAACRIDGGTVDAPAARCQSLDTPVEPSRAVLGRHGAHRVTARVTVGARELVGTAGDGVWDLVDRTRLTPAGQVCGNHVMAAAEFRGTLWLGTFADGICRRDGEAFVRVEAPFRMVNDLEATPRGLYVAANEGLFRTRDGASFEPVLDAVGRGVNGLDYDGEALWVTTAGSLWRVRMGGGPPTRGYWIPAGSVAVQDVAVAGGVAWIATEDRGVLRFDGTTFQVFDRAAGLASSWVYKVAAEPGGTALVATLQRGLWRLAPDGTTTEVPVGDAWLLHVSSTATGLLVGTQGGAWIVDAQGTSTAIAGLPDPRAHALLVHDGALWVGTEQGLLEAPLTDEAARRVTGGATRAARDRDAAASPGT